MRKLAFLLILTLGWLASSSQKYPPIQKYKMGKGYSVQEFKAFALKETKLSISYKQKVLGLVNGYLSKAGLAGKYPVIIEWIFHPSRTWPERRIYPNGFWNSRDENGVAAPFWDDNYFDGPMMVLHIDGYEFDIGKPICMNYVLEAPFISPKIIQLLPPANKELPAIALQVEEGWSMYEYSKKVDTVYHFDPLKKKDHKFPTVGKILIGAAVGALATWGISKLLEKDKPDSRTMPDGTDAPVVNEPRGMPDAIPGTGGMLVPIKPIVNFSNLSGVGNYGQKQVNVGVMIAFGGH